MKRKSSTNLVPEAHLLIGLSPIWRQRFEKAIAYIEGRIADANVPTWQEVCDECAVSEYHFHRMFKLVFGETSGQYINRKRMQYCVFLLLNEPDLRITEIAHEMGYASSQAMAKALKKMTGMSATQIRCAGNSFDTTRDVMKTLGHPGGDFHLEQQLASQLEFAISVIPERVFYTKALASASFFDAEVLWEKIKPNTQAELVTLTPFSELDKAMDLQEVMIGYECKPDIYGRSMTKLANFVIPQCQYLSVRVTVSSETGYMAVWDAVYAYICQQGIEPQDEGLCLEVLHNPEAMLVEPCDITLSIPIQFVECNHAK